MANKKMTENGHPGKLQKMHSLENARMENARPGNSQNGKFTQQEMVENALFGK